MPNALGTVQTLTGNANSLPSGQYASLGVIDFTTAPPHECLIEVSLQASAATSGNKQAVLYLRNSLDGTTFSVAPSATDAANARYLGAVSLPDAAARRSAAFPVSPLFAGALPQKIEIYVFNDSGVALASTGQVGQYRTETFG